MIKLLRSFVYACAGIGLWLPMAVAEPARFWLSTSDDRPDISSPPSVDLAQGATRQFHIWGQPGVSRPGNPGTPSEKLQSLSLNLVTSDEGLEFLFVAITVYNPVLDEMTGLQRFRLTGGGHDVRDDNLDACQDSNAGICSMTGFSFGPEIPNEPPDDGIGPECHPNDPFCKVIGNDSPAWLIASVAVRAQQNEGAANLFLQIGDNGIHHVGHRSEDTEVLFSHDLNGPIYRGARNVTLAGEQADATINFVPSPADYDNDGTVGPGDYELWRAAYGSTTELAADGDGNGRVDAADYVVWRNNVTVVELPGDYNGDGFVNAADYVVWRNSRGQTGDGLTADGNNDMVVDQEDYDLWSANFGSVSQGTGNDSRPVPEPTSTTLLMVLTAGLLTRRAMSLKFTSAHAAA